MTKKESGNVPRGASGVPLRARAESDAGLGVGAAPAVDAAGDPIDDFVGMGELEQVIRGGFLPTAERLLNGIRFRIEDPRCVWDDLGSAGVDAEIVLLKKENTSTGGMMALAKVLKSGIAGAGKALGSFRRSRRDAGPVRRRPRKAGPPAHAGPEIQEAWWDLDRASLTWTELEWEIGVDFLEATGRLLKVHRGAMEAACRGRDGLELGQLDRLIAITKEVDSSLRTLVGSMAEMRRLEAERLKRLRFLRRLFHSVS